MELLIHIHFYNCISRSELFPCACACVDANGYVCVCVRVRSGNRSVEKQSPARSWPACPRCPAVGLLVLRVFAPPGKLARAHPCRHSRSSIALTPRRSGSEGTGGGRLCLGVFGLPFYQICPLYVLHAAFCLPCVSTLSFVFSSSVYLPVYFCLLFRHILYTCSLYITFKSLISWRVFRNTCGLRNCR